MNLGLYITDELSLLQFWKNKEELSGSRYQYLSPSYTQSSLKIGENWLILLKLSKKMVIPKMHWLGVLGISLHPLCKRLEFGKGIPNSE